MLFKHLFWKKSPALRFQGSIKIPEWMNPSSVPQWKKILRAISLICDFHSIPLCWNGMTYKFTASIIKEGRWYVAHAVEFGVVSQGKTIPEAQKNLQEAVELYLEDQPRKKFTNEIPLLTVLDANV